MAATSEEKLVTMAENYYLDLRGSFDESIDKVAGSVTQTTPDNNINGCFCKERPTDFLQQRALCNHQNNNNPRTCIRTLAVTGCDWLINF